MDSIEQLFAEVYANPDDDHIRRVLADALLAKADPRGELIACQLSPDPAHRAMRLIQAHGLTWLGPLRGKLIPLAYERGFLAAVGLLPDVGPIDLELPMWGTVHTIDFENLSFDDLAAFRATPAMRSLRLLIGLHPRQLEQLRAQQPAEMERLRLVIHERYEHDPDEVYDPIVE